MAFIGRLHLLLIHFPIALVIAAVAAEGAAAVTADDKWHLVAVRNVRAGAVFAVLAAIAGWRLSLEMGTDASPLLEWHRWLGTIGGVVTFAAAIATAGAGSRSPLGVRSYRIALFAAAALVAVAAHLGGQLVWGANFLRP
jgi:uncharacterized membrane protein